ncbi:MAG: SDR family oxidoreductase [Treponema sp.]|jgi:NAD(P)-dependent dehydrogenase (short-subunit alcohol dehydrogenase family)|nr:SDR family oxidoreductase [Treponema sp.]
MSRDKTAIVTGAGKGIGEALALQLGRAGIAVVCNSVTDSAAAVVEKIRRQGGVALFVRGDVSKKEDVTRIAAETVKVFGGIDILVNNAGVVFPGTVENTSLEDWQTSMAVNVTGVFLLSQACIPYLVERKGVIVNNASSVALKGVKDRFAYTASKGAVLALTRSMAADLIEKGVRVNCVCPGTTFTPSLDSRLAQFENYEQKRNEFIARQPMGRFGTPEEIADGIFYLINAGFCTGTVLSVDGGMTM